jgi:hypothetical protein
MGLAYMPLYFPNFENGFSLDGGQTKKGQDTSLERKAKILHWKGQYLHS